MAGRPPEVDAAFEELALSPDTRPEDLRRAYLRLVKVRKPETDPEGFRKAREAFDLLSSWFAFLARTNEEPVPTPMADGPATAPVPLEGWGTLAPLLQSGQVAEARARIRELLEAKVTPPAMQPLLFLILDLHRQQPGPDAHATLAAFLAWVEHAQAELAFASQPERWLLVKELVKLPAQTPVEIERLLVEGILQGRFDPAMEGIEAFTKEHPAASDALILPLAEASPLLHQLLTPVLNTELITQRARGGVLLSDAEARLLDRRPGATAGGKWGMWIAFIVLFTMIRLVSGSSWLDGPPSQERFSRPRPPPSFPPPQPFVRPSTPITPSTPSTFDTPGTLAPTVDASPVGELCSLSMQDCLAARAVQANLLKGDCLHARLEYTNLINSHTLLSNSPAAEALRRTMGTLGVGLELCHSP